MLRKCLSTGLGVVALAGLGIFWFTRTPAQQPVQQLNARQGNGNAGPSLPLTQVVLFSSGVGYFQREGEVEGPARIDLQFPIGDVNDLLKSLVLQDMGQGKIGAISYDGQDPIEKTLRSFAVDLTGNPTLGQLLNQARGEKVEVVMQSTAANQPGTVTGVVMGMESEMQAHGPGAQQEVHLLNLACAEGIRSVNLREVQRIRFLNAKMQAELYRALEVLAGSHDALKKTVSLNFKGDGKRKVRVGYVAENPIWKTTYRLSLDKQIQLQGWAAVENVTDEDWNDLRVVLVSSRPISYQMDLYPPLFMPRPMVEPEKFASLRPPAYNGALTNDAVAAMRQAGGLQQGGLANFNGFGGGGNNQGFGGGITGFNGGNLGIGGGFQGAGGIQGNFAQNSLNQFGNLGGQFGQQGGNNRYQNSVNPMNPMTNYNVNGIVPQQQAAQAQNQDNNNNEGQVLQQMLGNNTKLTYEQLQQRRKQQEVDRNKNMDDAKRAGAVLTNLDPHQSIASVAAAEDIGDAFRYIIEDRISLPRQKSALLPLLDKSVEAKRVSIFNEAVHAKYPLLGLRFKNTCGQPLTQGPITVFEEGSYAGDSRMPDLQPDEERLLSYAVDLGSEVKSTATQKPGPKMAISVPGDQLRVQYTIRQTRKYTIRNRSPQDRLMVIEHPIRNNWKLVEPEKPRETSREVYRFDVPVAAGKTVEFDVSEEQVRIDPFAQQWTKQPSAEVHDSFFVTNLHLEVLRTIRNPAAELQNMKIVKGMLEATSKHKLSVTYHLVNRAETERIVTVEHGVPAEWKIIGEFKPVEGSQNLYRFPVTVAAGKAGEQTVSQETVNTAAFKVADVNEDTIRLYLASPAVSAKVKEALAKLSEQKAQLAELDRQIAELNKQLKDIAEDQTRLRQNLANVPATSTAHKRYLEKFDKQETQIEGLQESAKQKQEEQKKSKKELEQNVATLSVE
jgi:hypothetical protein